MRKVFLVHSMLQDKIDWHVVLEELCNLIDFYKSGWDIGMKIDTDKTLVWIRL